MLEKLLLAATITFSLKLFIGIHAQPAIQQAQTTLPQLQVERVAELSQGPS